MQHRTDNKPVLSNVNFYAYQNIQDMIKYMQLQYELGSYEVPKKQNFRNERNLLQITPIEQEQVKLESNSIKFEDEALNNNATTIEIEDEPITIEDEIIEIDDEPINTDSLLSFSSIAFENKSIHLEDKPTETKDEPTEMEDEPIEIEDEPIEIDDEPIDEQEVNCRIRNMNVEVKLDEAATPPLPKIEEIPLPACTAPKTSTDMNLKHNVIQMQSTATQTITPPMMCYNFVRRCCRRSPCRFVHEIIPDQLRNVYRFCRNFQNGTCLFGEHWCRYVHATISQEQAFLKTGYLPRMCLPRNSSRSWLPHIIARTINQSISQEPKTESIYRNWTTNEVDARPYTTMDWSVASIPRTETNLGGVRPDKEESLPPSANEHNMCGGSNFTGASTSAGPSDTLVKYNSTSTKDNKDLVFDDKTFKEKMEKCKCCDRRVSWLLNMNDRLWRTTKKFYTKIVKLKNTTTISEVQLSCLEDMIVATINVLKKQLSLCVQSIEDLGEAEPMTDALTFHGVPEFENENCRTSILLTIHAIGLAHTTASEITACHRIGLPKKGYYRPIMARFDTVDLKSAVWRARGKLLSSQIYVKEYVAKSKLSIFMKARQYFGENARLTNIGTIKVKMAKSVAYIITTAEELDDLIVKTSADASGGVAPLNAPHIHPDEVYWIWWDNNLWEKIKDDTD